MVADVAPRARQTWAGHGAGAGTGFACGCQQEREPRELLMSETTGEIRKHRHPGKGQRLGAPRPKGRQIDVAARSRRCRRCSATGRAVATC